MTPAALEACRTAAGRPEVVDALRSFFERADALIAARPATCWNRARCCHFGQFGHRLYVTALEVSYYLARAETEGQDVPVRLTEGVDSCPHAVDGQCHAREHRPLGCRVFFCDPEAQDWQGPLTEALLAELQVLHERLDVPYFYADWMTVLQGLSDFDDAATPAPAAGKKPGCVSLPIVDPSKNHSPSDGV